jgi:GNAT superfamily N-acetyltransferase
MSDVILEIVVVDFRSQEADSLVRALSEELAQRYNFADDGSGDFKPEDALVARSMFLVGRVGAVAVACGPFRPLEENVCEIKRMFVLPEHRGKGRSKAILAELERRARNGDRRPPAGSGSAL